MQGKCNNAPENPKAVQAKSWNASLVNSYPTGYSELTRQQGKVIGVTDVPLLYTAVQHCAACRVLRGCARDLKVTRTGGSRSFVLSYGPPRRRISRRRSRKLPQPQVRSLLLRHRRHVLRPRYCISPSWAGCCCWQTKCLGLASCGKAVDRLQSRPPIVCCKRRT